jgi:lipoyl(octanoyl) transferase
MAVDEALLEGAGQNNALPSLRLYAWDPACLSLGYAQPFSDVDIQALRERGWGLVRRPTGGRAILHTDEITYSVVGSTAEPRLTGGVLESYQNLSEAFLRALHDLKIPAEAMVKPSSAPPDARTKNPICFEVPSNYEITVGRKKLIGSAQARRKETMLQHGSLPLSGDLSRITLALIYPNEGERLQAARRVVNRAVTVEAILGKQVAWDIAAQVITDAFQTVLNLQLVLSDLSDKEIQRAGQLVHEKYANPAWTERI